MILTPFIGLEVHVQPKTKSKMFCSCSADFFGKEPNINICPICLGLPGALPVPNKKAIEKTIKLGLALNCTIQKHSFFERKNYFYPDLPKGYQISQYKKPLSINGWIDVDDKKIRINRVHQEEDTAKLMYQKSSQYSAFDPSGSAELTAEASGRGLVGSEYKKENIPTTDYDSAELVAGRLPTTTLIDFNRSGVPLTEIVSEPDIHSNQQAVAYLKKLQQVIRAIDFSDADMEKGTMRLEVNISLSTNEKLPSYKVELKNINSFRFVKKAIDYEIKRQTEIIKSGKAPGQETRGFDEKTGKTFPQRIKEEAHDYRYFPEPDIPALEISDDWIKEIKSPLLQLPDEKINHLINKHQISAKQAQLLVKLGLTKKFEEVIDQIGKTQEVIIEVAKLLINRPLTRTMTNEKIQQLISKPQDLISDDKLAEIVEKVIADNPKAVGDYKKGKKTVIKFLIGQVMRKVQGKAEARKIEKILKEKLKLRG